VKLQPDVCSSPDNGALLMREPLVSPSHSSESAHSTPPPSPPADKEEAAAVVEEEATVTHSPHRIILRRPPPPPPVPRVKLVVAHLSASSSQQKQHEPPPAPPPPPLAQSDTHTIRCAVVGCGTSTALSPRPIPYWRRSCTGVVRPRESLPGDWELDPTSTCVCDKHFHEKGTCARRLSPLLFAHTEAVAVKAQRAAGLLNRFSRAVAPSDVPRVTLEALVPPTPTVLAPPAPAPSAQDDEYTEAQGTLAEDDFDITPKVNPGRYSSPRFQRVSPLARWSEASEIQQRRRCC
jgi:hypothetical protein